MRVKSDSCFAEYLLCVSGGFEEMNGDEIRLPRDICVPHTREDSDLDMLIDGIFPNLNANMKQRLYHLSSDIIYAERVG
jgi:ATP-dependent DNA helicase PIF1